MKDELNYRLDNFVYRWGRGLVVSYCVGSTLSTDGGAEWLFPTVWGVHLLCGVVVSVGVVHLLCGCGVVSYCVGCVSYCVGGVASYWGCILLGVCIYCVEWL